MLTDSLKIEETEELVPEVLLFCKYAFHDSILGPITKELDNSGITTWLTGKRHLVYDKFERVKKKYPIIVIADEWVELFRDIAETVIAIGHSPANKNTTLNSRNRDADYIYCSSQYYKNEFIKRGVIPKKEIIVTGYPAASKLFRREMNIHSKFTELMSDSRIKVLFAPTYNRDLNILDALIEEENKSELFARLHHYLIMFKLHPVLNKKYPDQAEWVRNLSLKYSNVYYHESSHDDITDAILSSNIIIGDCSGAMLLAAAGDKPVITYNNPNRERSPYFDKEGPEWKFREDYAYEIDREKVGNLPIIIEEYYKNDYKKTKRKSVVDLLFDNQTNAEKIAAQHIVGLL